MGKACQKCGRRDHFAKMCYTGRQIQILSYDDDEEEDDGEHHVGVLDACREDAWYTSVKVNGSLTKFKLDTGAEVNLIPRHMLGRINVESVRPTKTRLTAFGGSVLLPIGKITAQCVAKGRTVNLEFYVVDFASTPILGLPGCTELKLIDRIEEVRHVTESKKKRKPNSEEEVTATPEKGSGSAKRGASGYGRKTLLKTKQNKQTRKEKLRLEQNRRNEQTWKYIMEGRDPVDGSKVSGNCGNRTVKENDLAMNDKSGKKL